MLAGYCCTTDADLKGDYWLLWQVVQEEDQMYAVLEF